VTELSDRILFSYFKINVTSIYFSKQDGNKKCYALNKAYLIMLTFYVCLKTGDGAESRLIHKNVKKTNS
jgi:hypothetical protein